MIATAIRGAGGMAIRRKQAELLKRCVAEGDPLFQKLAQEVGGLMEILATPEAGALDAELAALKTLFINLPDPGQAGIPLERARLAWESFEVRKRGMELSKSAASAASRLARAHSALRENLNQRRDPAQLFEEIESLRSEISAARRIYNELKH